MIIFCGNPLLKKFKSDKIVTSPFPYRLSILIFHIINIIRIANVSIMIQIPILSQRIRGKQA